MNNNLNVKMNNRLFFFVGCSHYFVSCCWTRKFVFVGFGFLSSCSFAWFDYWKGRWIEKIILALNGECWTKKLRLFTSLDWICDYNNDKEHYEIYIELMLFFGRRYKLSLKFLCNCKFVTKQSEFFLFWNLYNLHI